MEKFYYSRRGFLCPDGAWSKKGRAIVMLVLSRKVRESIILAGVIKVSVLSIEGDRVKIGISAPSDVAIVREELLNNRAELNQSREKVPV
jgi:carbon storage regulator